MGRTEKLPIVKNAEDRAIELMIGEKQGLTDTREKLIEEGYGDIPIGKLQVIKKNAFDSLVQQYKAEATAEFMLESLKKITLEFEDLYNKFKGLYDQFEGEGKSFEQLIVLKELRTMLHMGLKKLGEYKSGIENIKQQNVYISNSDVILMVKQAQDKMFTDSSPEYTGGKLIFNNPRPELVDSYNKWKFKNAVRLK